MSQIAIKVENLSKKYIISHEKKSAHYETFSETLIQGSKNFAKKIIHPFSGKEIDPQTQEEFWALKDINFEINQGDKVGIIGRNGAGKSTLLKVLSRITEPTSGKIHINGRIASLLEVGTGFHPELTGRENIYLNGAILGMSRKEIKAKFDEIVAFAEVDKFLDTPVKRYSSGMYVRLAFSVAAHLEPEILIVDEVLAVGDAQFQKKCLGKMEEVGNLGRTVLFVSHNMGAVEMLCKKVIQLSEGAVVKTGKTSSVIQNYLSQSFFTESTEVGIGFKVNKIIKNQKEDSYIHLTKVGIENIASPTIGPRTGEPLKIKIFYKTNNYFSSPAFVVKLKDVYGMEICRLSTMPISGFQISKLFSCGIIELIINKLPLVAGTYCLDIGVTQERIQWILNLNEVIEFDVLPNDVYGSGIMLDRSRGVITVDHFWNHTQQN